MFVNLQKADRGGWNMNEIEKNTDEKWMEMAQHTFEESNKPKLP